MSKRQRYSDGCKSNKKITKARNNFNKFKNSNIIPINSNISTDPFIKPNPFTPLKWLELLINFFRLK